jgi:hypothetical protein
VDRVLVGRVSRWVTPRPERGDRVAERASGSTLSRKEAWLVAALSLAAAGRVFLFAATFPFFGNMDEHAHVDLVHKYARGYRPGPELARFDPEMTRLFVRYGSYEFIHPRSRFPGGRYPRPVPELPPEVAARVVEAGAGRWAGLANHETHAPPVYHALAGAWYGVLGRLGLGGVRRLYFVRFLNVPIVAVLVWGAYRFCAKLFPGRTEIRIGVPLLLAFVPLDAFYVVHPDVLSPALFIGALALQLEWYSRDEPATWLGVAAACLTGLTIVARPTNLALAPVLACLTGRKAIRLCGARGRAAALRAFIGVTAAALVPVAALVAWNVLTAGDVTGTRAKIEYLGWTPATLATVLEHPLLSPGGLWTFWSELLHKLWRGELRWHVDPLANPVADAFYAGSSTLLLLAAAVSWIRSRRVARPAEGASGGVALGTLWASVSMSVLSLAVLSMAFDFGDSFYPSAEHPFFTSGRLISGALVPFLILYVEGVAYLFRPWSRVAGPLAFVALTAAGATVSEVLLTLPVFANPLNWFHLP